MYQNNIYYLFTIAQFQDKKVRFIIQLVMKLITKVMHNE